MTHSPITLQTLKGFRDFLPKDAKKRQWLIGKIRDVCELWGFVPLETPTLEYAELFAGLIGEDEKLFFQFEDQGGRNVALRYDQTVPACRVVSQYRNEIKLPFKRYQIQPAFRSEKPQKGRYREFLQIDADIFGVDSPEADAEVIALGLDIYRTLGFKQVQVLINDRALLKHIPYEAIVAIDKLKKIGEEGVLEDMKKKGISEEKAREYLTYIQTIQPNERINTILSYLKNAGFPEDWYSFEPTIARSFAYSDGPIWEVVVPGFEVGSVLGGERFDGIIEVISGTKIPATGFGLGFDRTYEAAEQFGLIPELETQAQVLVTVFDTTLLPKSLEVIKYLRESHISSELYPDSSIKLGKQIKYANDKQIPFVIIIGPDEAKEDKVSLKNMKTGEEKRIVLSDLSESIIQSLS